MLNEEGVTCIMEEESKISPRQLRRLTMQCFIGTSVLSIPGSLATYSKQDAWIAALLGILWGVLLVWMYTSLGNYMSNMTLIQYVRKLLGKWLGTSISLLLFLFFFINCSTLVYILGNFVKSQMLINTPLITINLVFITVVVIGARSGLETFSRTAEILYLFCYIFFAFVVIFLLRDIEFRNIQPIFGSGIKPNLKGSLLFSVFTSISLLLPLMMIYPSRVINKAKAKKLLFGAILEGGVILFIVILLSILILGPGATARYSYPTYELVKKISIAGIIERFEASITFLWFSTLFFKSVLYFYVSILSLDQIFRLEKSKCTSIPLGMILLILSLIVYPSTVYMAEWDTTTWVSIAVTFGVFLPIILLLISKIKNKIKNS